MRDVPGQLHRQTSASPVHRSHSFTATEYSKTFVGPPVSMGVGGVSGIEFGTLASLFHDALIAGGDSAALKGERARYGDSIEWLELSWTQYYNRAVQFAKALLSLRVAAHSRVFIVSRSSVELCVSFMGSILSGCIPALSSPELTFQELLRQAELTEAEVIVVDTSVLLKKFLSSVKHLPQVKQIICANEVVSSQVRLESEQVAIQYEQFMALSGFITDAQVQHRVNGLLPQSVATIAFTSGTTDEPKGVMLTHDNLQFTAACLSQAHLLSDIGGIVHLALLPCGTAVAVIFDIILPMLIVAAKGTMFTAHFIRYRGDFRTLASYMRAVRPTFFVCGPSLYNDLALCIRAAEARRSESEAKLSRWAKSVARECSLQRQMSHSSGAMVPIKGAALAASMNDKIKMQIGMDRAVQTICAGGPVPQPLLEELAGCGFDVLQVYTCTETSGIATTCTESRFAFGSCGYCFAGTEAMVDHVPSRDKQNEGELCLRGRHVMLGYVGSGEGVDIDGWFHTGDICRVDPESQLLYVVSRAGDAIMTNSGDRVYPAVLEAAIYRRCSAISRAVVVGEHRNFLVALMTLKSARNPETGAFTDDLVGGAEEVNPDVATVTSARRDEKWLKMIANVIAQCNAQAPNAAHKIYRFCILPTDFSVVGGELTPTEHIKRASVLAKYAALIDKLYQPPVKSEPTAAASTPRKS
jgi:long-subunit acyl-CoA synthetase (AMP-forming)